VVSAFAIEKMSWLFIAFIFAFLAISAAGDISASVFAADDLRLGRFDNVFLNVGHFAIP
jgi:hypothetical protein